MNAEHPTDHTPEVHSELDAWHRHDPSEGLPQQEHAAHANIGVLLVTFVVITVATVAFAVAIGFYALGQIDSLRGEREVAGLRAVSPEAQAYKRAAMARQESYGWTETGTVRLPIDRAIEVMVAEHTTQENPRR
jgi:hypothetical protein